MSKPYTIENTRPHRVVPLYGRILASKHSGGKTTLDLSLEELLGEACVRLFRESRIALVRGEMPSQLVELLAPSKVDVDVLPEVTEEPVLAPPPPLEPEKVVVEDSIDPPAEPESGEPVAEVHTAESLKTLTVKELRALCKSLALKPSGTEDELVERILAHQMGEV